MQAVWYEKFLKEVSPWQPNQQRNGPGIPIPAKVKLKLNNSLHVYEKLASLHHSLKKKNH